MKILLFLISLLLFYQSAFNNKESETYFTNNSNQLYHNSDSIVIAGNLIKEKTDSSKEIKKLFFNLFPSTYSEIKNYYGYKGKIDSYASEHIELFYKIIADSNIISLEAGIRKVNDIVSNYDTEVDDLAKVYVYTSIYLNEIIGVNNVSRYLKSSEIKSLIIFFGQSKHPYVVKTLDSFLTENNLSQHHRLVESVLQKMKKNTCH